MKKKDYIKDKFIFVLEEKIKEKTANKEKIKTNYLRKKGRKEIFREVKETIDEIDLVEIENIITLLCDEYQYLTSNIKEKYFNYIIGTKKNKFTKNNNAKFEYSVENLNVKLGSKIYILPKKLEPVFDIINKNNTFLAREVEIFLNKNSTEEFLSFLVDENIIFHI